MTKEIRVGRGRMEVRIGGAIAVDLARDFRQLLGPLVDRLQELADGILADDVRPNWPVKTGKSLAGWGTAMRVDPDRGTLEVVLTNDVPYVRYIQSARKAKTPDSVRIRSPLSAHVRKPARAARRLIRQEFPQMLATGLAKAVKSAG